MKRAVSLVVALLIMLSAGNSTWAEEYRLGPGDVLAISVWGFEELQVKDIAIRPDGKIAFPIVGEVQASGLSPSELTEALRVGINSQINDPKVAVNITKFRTTRIYVLGEVVRPGMYEIEKQHNLLDAIGIAGGYTKDAAKKKVFILGKDQSNQPQEANLLKLLQRGDMTQNYVLHDGDTVVLTSNNRIDIARDILPFMASAYYINYSTKK